MNKWTVWNKKVIGTIFVLGLLVFAAFAITVKEAKAVGPLPVNLGSAATFSVLAASAVSNTGPTIVTGNVGLSPTTGTGISGFPPGAVTGTIYAVDAFGPAGSVNNPGLLTIAKNDLTAAYLDAAGRPTDLTIATELGGTTRGPGVYDSLSGTFEITGILTLDGGGDPNAVFIFKMASTLTTAAGNSQIVLINGAQAFNVFWVVGSSATLGTNTAFMGNILASSSITVTTGAIVNGQLLALNGAVTLDTNTINTVIERISLAPLSRTNPIGASHTVTATVTLVGTGSPVVGRLVTFSIVAGPNAFLVLPGSATTDINGQATFTYSSSVTGTDYIQASFLSSSVTPIIVTDARPLAPAAGVTVISNQVTKTWTSTSPTPTITPTITPTATPTTTPTVTPTPSGTPSTVGGEIVPISIASVLLSQYSAVIVLLIILSATLGIVLIKKRKKS